MYTFHIISVGPLKEPAHRELTAEYTKRLSGACKIKKTEIPASKLSPDPSDAEICSALSSEAKAILRVIPRGAHKIALCVEGRRFDSPGFAEYLRRAADGGASEITFIIGSSYGLDESVKSACELRLSVSDFTFPHGMMQPILYEIIYRSYSIITGGKYHK